MGSALLVTRTTVAHMTIVRHRCVWARALLAARQTPVVHYSHVRHGCLCHLWRTWGGCAAPKRTPPSAVKRPQTSMAHSAECATEVCTPCGALGPCAPGMCRFF